MTIEEKVRIAKECFECKDWKIIDERSRYNRNYYLCSNGYVVYAESDDDNETDYYLEYEGDNKYFHFAYSMTTFYNKLIWEEWR